ncbi:hypothetical protein K502DRAFT_247294 [Neoconidiobolus thromboides FSU 785]|nr:hypothetical protein K502DRAFT_247294 [Neoconidiobolus thromboides FSU 785]
MRPQKSCTSCYKRKQKCDLTYPCARCIKIGATCQYLNQNEKHAIGYINTKDIERLEKKWNMVEVLAQNLKSIIEGNNRYPSISSITMNRKMPELIMNLGKRQNFSPYVVKLCNTRIEQELLNIYFKYHHPTQPFLNEFRVRSMIFSQELEDRILLSAICAIALKIYNYLKRLPLLEIDNNPYYQYTKKFLSKRKEPSLNVLQAMMLLIFMEMGHSRPFKAFCLSTEAIKIGQILGLHNLNVNQSPFELTDTEMESIKSWVHCLTLDTLTSLFQSKPSHFKNNESLLKNTINKELEGLYMLILPCHKEKEYLFVHSFHYMVKLKSSIIWINNALQSGSYSIKQVYYELLGLIQAMKLAFFQHSIQMEDEVLNMVHDITIDDSTFISNLVLAALKISFSLFANFLIYKVTELGDEADSIISIEYRSKAYLDSIKLYQLLSLTEKRYCTLLSKDFSKVIYGSDFCYCLGLEIAILCHQSDTTTSSKSFAVECQKIQHEFSVFWPLIQNPLTKSQMMKVHVPDSIVPPTPNYNT